MKKYVIRLRIFFVGVVADFFGGDDVRVERNLIRNFGRNIFGEKASIFTQPRITPTLEAGLGYPGPRLIRRRTADANIFGSKNLP